MPKNIKQIIEKKALEDFWEIFFDNALTEAKRSFDIGVYNSISNNQYRSLLKSIFYMYEVSENLNRDSSEQSDALIKMLKNLLTYVNTDSRANIFTSQVNSILKQYSNFDSNFACEFLGEKAFSSERFKEGKGNWEDLRSYGVLRGTGLPVLVNENSLGIISPGAILSGDELLYLKCVRVFAENPRPQDPDKEKNLKVQKLNYVRWGTNKSSVNPYQTGILELYAELDTRKNILSVWVLSTGGRDNISHERPYDWPKEARPQDWNKSEYKYLITYISKGTWKLNNLSENFSWD